MPIRRFKTRIACTAVDRQARPRKEWINVKEKEIGCISSYVTIVFSVVRSMSSYVTFREQWLSAVERICHTRRHVGGAHRGQQPPGHFLRRQFTRPVNKLQSYLVTPQHTNCRRHAKQLNRWFGDEEEEKPSHDFSARNTTYRARDSPYVLDVNAGAAIVALRLKIAPHILLGDSEIQCISVCPS